MADVERDRAASWLHSFTRGQELTVGKHRFRVENTYGVTVYVTKGKGKKLYKLEVFSLDPPFTVDVREVWPGSGEFKDEPPIARFQP